MADVVDFLDSDGRVIGKAALAEPDARGDAYATITLNEGETFDGPLAKAYAAPTLIDGRSWLQRQENGR